MATSAQPLHACHCCGQIQYAPAESADQIVKCVRCSTKLHQPNVGRRSLRTTAALTIGAFILFWPAILLPILGIEKLGHYQQSSIIVGIVELFEKGNWFVGSIVLLFSVVFPLVKLLMLLELSFIGMLHRQHRALTYRVMEQLGKWSMLDVLLLALMVMSIKLGSLVEFHFGPAVLAFVFCVGLSIIASIHFDPHSIWESEDE